MRSTRHVIQKQKESETFCLLQKYFDDFTISQSFKSHQFLQRRNQTRKTIFAVYIDNKIDELFKPLKIIKENISLYDVVDAPSNYFQKSVSMLQFVSECMEFS